MKTREPEKELKVCWSNREDDIMVYYPSSATGHMIWGMLNEKRLRSGMRSDHVHKHTILATQNWNEHFIIYEDKSFLEELEDRGYDIKTLKISIRKKDDPTT